MQQTEGEYARVEGGPLVVRMLEEVERFRQGLRSERSEERYASVRALRMLGKKAQGTAADVLRLALGDGAWRVQVEAAETFAGMGVDIEEHREALVQALRAPGHEWLVNASFVLHALGSQAQPLRGEIVRLLRQEQDVSSYFLLGCLAQLEPIEENARILRGQIEKRGRELLFFFVEAFCKMGPRVLPVLREGIETHKPIVRLVCAASLWAQCRDAEAMALLEAAREDDAEVSCVASCLLVRLGLWQPVDGLFKKTNWIQDRGLFSLMLSSICNVAHEAPDWVVEKMRGLLEQRDPALLESVFAACGRLGRLGGALSADLMLLFRQVWGLWVTRRAPVSFRLLLRDRFPLWFPWNTQEPDHVRMFGPKIFPEDGRDSETQAEWRRWAESLLFRLIDTVDSGGLVDALRLRKPLEALLMAEDLSWTLRHAAAEALGRQIHEEELSPMLRAASRATDHELVSGVLLGLERKMEIAKVLAEIAEASKGVCAPRYLGDLERSVEADAVGEKPRGEERLAWYQSERLFESCRQKERKAMLEGFLKHRDAEVAWLGARLFLLTGEAERVRPLVREWLDDARWLVYGEEVLRRLIRSAESGEGEPWKEDAQAICAVCANSDIPMIRLLSAVWGRMLGLDIPQEADWVEETEATEAADWVEETEETKEADMAEEIEAADLTEGIEAADLVEETEEKLWRAWWVSQGWEEADVRSFVQGRAGRWKMSDIACVLFAPVWGESWCERCMLRLVGHLVGRYLGQFGAWRRADVAEMVEMRVGWSKGVVSCEQMQAAYVQATDLHWDALLLRNQQEHFSTQRINGVYHLSVVVQTVLRPGIGREPSIILQALLAAQEFHLVCAVEDGVHPEAWIRAQEADARVRFCDWMGGILAEEWANFEMAQAAVQRWRKEGDALLFSGI